MPTVGTGAKKKKFAYTPKGEAEAAAYAKQTGQKETYHPPAKKKAAPARGKKRGVEVIIAVGPTRKSSKKRKS